MELEHGPLEQGAERDRLVDLAAVDPVRHQRVDAQGRGDGRALEVLGLAVVVLGQVDRRHVEARQAGQAAQDEEGEAHVVQRRAHADREGNYCRGDAEGDLRGCGC